MVSLAGCPLSQGGPTGPVSPTAEVLAEDVEALAKEAARTRVPEPTGLVEAYLEHHRGGEGAAREGAAREGAARASLCRWLDRAGLSVPAAAARVSALKIPGKRRLRSFVAAILALGSCEASPAPGPVGPSGASPRAATFRPGHHRGTVTRAQGGHSERIDESWLLVSAQEEITGWVLRRVTRTSTDGRRFVCSGTSMAVTQLVALVTGDLREGRLTLRSTATYVDFGPCAPTQAPRLECTGTPTAEGIQLACPEEIRLTHLGEGLPMGAGKVFAWQGKTPRAEGGRDAIGETWHLAPVGDTLMGFYLRETLASMPAPRSFSCNGRASFVTQRLFLLTGTRGPGGVTVKEVAAFRVPGPCDREKITLDRYAGEMRGETLVLRYGEGSSAGSQTLLPVGGASCLAPALPWPTQPQGPDQK